MSLLATSSSYVGELPSALVKVWFDRISSTFEGSPLCQKISAQRSVVSVPQKGGLLVL